MNCCCPGSVHAHLTTCWTKTSSLQTFCYQKPAPPSQCKASMQVALPHSSLSLQNYSGILQFLFFFFLMQVTILVIAASFTASFGVIHDIRESSPVGFFRLLFGDAVLDLILRETTLYTEQYFERKREFLEAHLQAQAHEWRRAPLTRKEVEMFIALLIGIGICDYPTRIILFHVQLHDFLH